MPCYLVWITQVNVYPFFLLKKFHYFCVFANCLIDISQNIWRNDIQCRQELLYYNKADACELLCGLHLSECAFLEYLNYLCWLLAREISPSSKTCCSFSNLRRIVLCKCWILPWSLYSSILSKIFFQLNSLEFRDVFELFKLIQNK